MFYAVNVTAPADFWDCHDSGSSITFGNFVTGWAAAVAASSAVTAGQATEQWFNETGNTLLAELKDNFACEDKTASQ